jgi:hypothetical protein
VLVSVLLAGANVRHIEARKNWANSSQKLKYRRRMKLAPHLLRILTLEEHMKLNKSEVGRTLHALCTTEPAPGFILVERVKHQAGSTKWDEQRIFINFEEIEKLFNARPGLQTATSAAGAGN